MLICGTSSLPYIDDEEANEEQIDSVVETPVDDRYTDDSSDSSMDSDSSDCNELTMWLGSSVVRVLAR